MGTRNLTCVKIDGEFKLAQYGQWDGYAEGQGSVVLDFCSTPGALYQLQKGLDRVEYEFDADELQEQLDGVGRSAFFEEHPLLTRDTAAQALDIIATSEGASALYSHNEHDFGYDGLMCEYAYVIDLDENKLCAYKGWAKIGADLKGHWADTYEQSGEESRAGQGYGPVTLVAEWSLNDLPELEAFIEAIDPEEPDED